MKPGDALKPRRKENFARLDAKELPELLGKIDAYTGSPYTRLAPIYGPRWSSWNPGHLFSAPVTRIEFDGVTVARQEGQTEEAFTRRAIEAGRGVLLGSG